MSLTTRRITAADSDAFWALGTEAFGASPPGTPPSDPARWPGPGRDPWGTFDGDRMVARAVGKDLDSWFGGRQVPTCGVAGVTVTAEYRGRGLLDELMRAVLDSGRERGAVVSTLFPTAPGIYRRHGYEIVGGYDTVELPTAAAAGVRLDEALNTRRIGPGDREGAEAVRAVYDAWARHQQGPLTRRGASYPDDRPILDGPAGAVGVSVAEDASRQVRGYVAWRRGPGYDDDAVLEVEDLIGLDEPAVRTLWRLLGTFASVTGRIRLHTTAAADTARLVLPSLAWRVTGSHAYMLRVDDVPGAFSGLPAAEISAGSAAFRVDASGYRLSVVDGRTVCEPADPAPDAPTFSRRGLALALTGAQSWANLLLAGLVQGDAEPPAALFGSGPVQIRDYF